MTDFYMKLNGDITLNGHSDIGLTQQQIRQDVQQVYIRLMTEPGDYYLYPLLGTELSRLYGMPQTYDTGQIGIRLIREALDREGVFRSKTVNINAVPVDRTTIRFDVNVIDGYNGNPVTISVSQALEG